MSYDETQIVELGDGYSLRFVPLGEMRMGLTLAGCALLYLGREIWVSPCSVSVGHRELASGIIELDACEYAGRIWFRRVVQLDLASRKFREGVVDPSDAREPDFSRWREMIWKKDA